MTEKPNNTEELTENPHVIYINSLQKHIAIVTTTLYFAGNDNNIMKKSLLGLIGNLSPIGKKKFQNVIEQLESNRYVSTNTLWQYFREVHDFVYDTILKEAFKLKPLSSEKPHISDKQ